MLNINNEAIGDDFIYSVFMHSAYDKECIKKVYGITKSFDKTLLAIKIASKLRCDVLCVAEVMKEEVE